MGSSLGREERGKGMGEGQGVPWRGGGREGGRQREGLEEGTRSQGGCSMRGSVRDCSA
jgi:hypothetical protein